MKKLALILLLPCLLLASLAFSQTQQGYVMSCYTKALDILNKILNKNHPYIASTYGNIANVLTKQSDFKKALEYYRTSLSIQKTVLGEQHSLVATNYYYLGRLYYYQNDYSTALEYHTKALEIMKSLFGENHQKIEIVKSKMEDS